MYQFGDNYTFDKIREYKLVNVRELVEYIVDLDGAGHYLATYDGKELEYDGYYAYRTN